MDCFVPRGAVAAAPAPGTVAHQTIIVLDFGSQYTQLIARRLRELSVYSEIWPPETPAETIRARSPVGIILSGGPKSVSDAAAPKCDPALFDLGHTYAILSSDLFILWKWAEQMQGLMKSFRK